MDKDRSELTKERKREERMRKYLSGEGIEFRNAEAAKMYKERASRLMKAMMCEKPDRVPVNLPSGFFPAYYGGYNLKTVMNDYQALEDSWMKFMNDFYYDSDTFSGPMFIFSARALETLDYRSYKWPGHGLGDDVNTFQFVEEAYMKADEYDYLLKDPSDFAFRVMVPREVGSLAPLANFPALHGLMSMPMTIAYPFTNPKMRNAFRSLIEAGEEIEKLQKYAMRVNRASIEAGFPPSRGGMGVAPFDVIADFLRGTQGSVMDMYRQPEKLLEAIDMITEMTIKRIIATANATGGFFAHFPLHKGDDTFMSKKQFEKFYWPSLKKVIDALIDEGIMSMLFAEGRYNQRLEYIGDFPRGWVQWQFDQTDMANAKKTIGNNCCIAGNVPASVILTGTPQDVKDCCRKLIETCAPGGGYILTGGASATEARPENLKAFMEAAKEYGVYKK
jgi:uroporphyrinogen-III decarboxylase